jgi:hypothetical protein
MSHALRTPGTCLLQRLDILWRPYHSSNIIFLMGSLAVSWFPPAHYVKSLDGGRLGQHRCPTYFPCSWQPWPCAFPEGALEEGGMRQARAEMLTQLKGRGSCDSVFVKC